MSIGEQIALRIVLIIVLIAFVTGFRVLKALIIRGWRALNRSSDPRLPVVPYPVKDQEYTRRQDNRVDPSSQKPQEYTGTIPLGDDDGGIPATEPVKQISYTLRSISGPFAGREMTLQPNREYTIGRNPGCTIRFPDQTPGISSSHCTLEYIRTEVTGGGSYQILYLTDSSTYGTYLEGGRRVPSGTRVDISEGAAFRLGTPTGPGFTIVKKII